jgi:hypothetical protein
VFTARYALSPYIKQIRFVFKGIKQEQVALEAHVRKHNCWEYEERGQYGAANFRWMSSSLSTSIAVIFFQTDEAYCNNNNNNCYYYYYYYYSLRYCVKQVAILHISRDKSEYIFAPQSFLLNFIKHF